MFLGCIENDRNYQGININQGTATNNDRRASLTACLKLCQKTTNCELVSYKKPSGNCFLKEKRYAKHYKTKPNWTSARLCALGKELFVVCNII